MDKKVWNRGTAHLTSACPIMGRLIAAYPGEGLTRREDGFYTLLRAVVGQQISVKAADAIWRRMEQSIRPLAPEKLARMRISSLRAFGLSEQKAGYAKNIARFWMETNPNWQDFSDEEVIAALTRIKGVGRWTAEMFLMFHLTRTDVLPLKDLGLLKAIDLHYPARRPRKTEDYQALAEDWRPYRSIATWYLWRALDPIPVEY